MFLEYKVKLITPFMPSPELVSGGKVVIPASELKGLTRHSFHRLLNLSKDEEDSIFGTTETTGKIAFEDVIYKGETRISARIKIKENREVDKDALTLDESIPGGVELIGRVHISPDITIRQINIVRHSLFLLEVTRVGRMRSHGYGECAIEFPDLEKAGMVFLSYAWEDEAHNEWVLNLADNLVRSGIFVIYDRYDLGIGDNFQVFMENGIEKANKVLLIFTPHYKEKAMSRKGGVGYEYSLINSELYEVLANNKKFLPILRKGDIASSIPPVYKQYILSDMRDDGAFEKNFRELYLAILGQKQVTRPQSPWR